MSASGKNPGHHDDGGSRHLDADRQHVDADRQIDVLLREVPPRSGREPDLAELFSDAAIDRILRDVPCRMTTVQPLDNGRGRVAPVDLQAVGLETRSAGIARRSVVRATPVTRRPRQLVRSAIDIARDALSVAAVLAIVVAMFAASTLASRWLSQPSARIATTPPHGLDFTSSAPRGVDPVVMVLADHRRSDVSAEAAGDATPVDSSSAESGGAEAVADAASTAGSTVGRLGRAERDDRPVLPNAVASEGGAFEGDADGSRADRSAEPPPELRAAPLTSSGPGVRGGVPGWKTSGPAGDLLQVIASRPSVDRAVPYHRGYDLAFEMTHGEAPFVDPSLNPALSVDRPPLTRRTDSFDRVEHLMAAGGLRRDQLRQALSGLRVEEVLAAVAPAAVPGTPPAAGPAVRIVGAPSISGRPSARLLEVSVTAPAAPRSRSSGDLLLVLDGSAAAGADEAWPAICRGVEEAILRLDPSASVTIVVFAEQPAVIASRVAAGDVIDIRRRLAEIRPRGGGDLHGCLAMVRREFKPQNAPVLRVVVAHAGSIARAERDGDPDLAAWRRSQQVDGDAEAGDSGIVLGDDGARGDDGPRDDDGIGAIDEVVVIDAVSGVVGDTSERIETSRLHGVGLDSMLIRRSIVAASLGNTVPTIEGCRLEVAFDPSQVAAYRLIGHRRQVADMTSSRSSTVDLNDGECVQALYEVVLRERNPREGSAAVNPQTVNPQKVNPQKVTSQKMPPEAMVARATCRYRRPGEAAESSIVVGISASQLAVDPAADDPAAQAAWLAAAVSELAAGSAHVESPQRLRETLRQRFDRLGDESGDSPGADLRDEAARMLRQLRGMWTLL